MQPGLRTGGTENYFVFESNSIGKTLESGYSQILSTSSLHGVWVRFHLNTISSIPHSITLWPVLFLGGVQRWGGDLYMERSVTVLSAGETPWLVTSKNYSDGLTHQATSGSCHLPGPQTLICTTEEATLDKM